MKKIVMIVAVVIIAVVVILAAVIFFYRYQLMQYSADALIRKSLPSYIQVDKITFELDNKSIVLRGFKILNPPGFSDKYLLETQVVTCAYKMRGANILDGIEVLEPVLDKPVLTVERLGDGVLNLTRMPQYIQSVAAKPQPGSIQQKSWLDTKKMQEEAVKRVQQAAGNKTFADMVKLPQTFSVKKGRLVFIDRNLSSRAYTISLDNIEADMSLKLDKTYTKVLSVGTRGEGVLNGQSDQTVKWNSIYDPTTPRLTMGNRFVVSGLDLLTFRPYYDRFSPFDFKRGTFSGTLVFDFDNGNIGSANEIRLGNLAFSIKGGSESVAFWGVPVQDMAKYFMSPQGDIVFDFKLKGDMSNPRPELGPISKRAITAMAVDKISQVLQTVAEQSKGAATSGEGKKTDMDKAISIISEIISKQK